MAKMDQTLKILNMKNFIIFILTTNIMCFNVQSQTKSYDKHGNKKSCIVEDLSIIFQKSNVTIPTSFDLHKNDTKELSIAFLISTALPAVINTGFKFIDSQLKKKVMEYQAEYFHSSSYLDAGSFTMPDFTFKRQIWHSNDNTEGETALLINFKAKEISKLSGVMVYYVDSIEQNYSKARVNKNDRLDFTIVITQTFIDKNGTATSFDLSPFSIRSLNFDTYKEKTDNYKYMTDIFVLPKDAFLSKISVKIIETNPKKYTTEKILNNWTLYKDDLKEGIIDPIVSQFLKDKLQEEDDEKQWQIAVSINSEEKYLEYLEKYPGGKHNKEASDRIKTFKNNNDSNGSKYDSVGSNSN